MRRAGWRPVPCPEPGPGALALAGGPCRFDRVERIAAGEAPRVAPADEAPADVLARLAAPRPALCGLALDRPLVMGILNVTPDSFSDGGEVAAPEAAVARALEWGADADLLDVGGESTRPGAREVPEAEEIARVVPVIRALRAAGIGRPISIDTRKAAVAEAALDAGASLVNDVTALRWDPAMAPLVAARGVPVVLMHSIATPETMQAEARYGDVVAEVFDHLLGRIEAAEAAGIARERIVVDPGIGFGKTLQHNVSLLRALALLHDTGCPILLGASRKRFVGTLSGADDAGDRLGGSLAVALHGAAQGAQVLRVHDVTETARALRLRAALAG